MAEVSYQPAGPTLKAFHESNAFVRGIMGPVGSAKSTTCAVEILDRAMRQAKDSEGRRRTRWAVIRNSYPELKSTTIKTWQEWCPPSAGKFTLDSPIVHHVQGADGLDAEVLFLALDRDDDMRKLLSLELTGAWVNEAREIPKGIIDTLTGRVGRFPPARDGGCTWSGIIMDTNPPDTESWWYRLAEEDTPAGWQFFHQPSGECPDAENLQWLMQTADSLTWPLEKRRELGRGYYERLKAGKDDDWIKVYVRGEYGFIVEGKPVYPMYRDRVHVAAEPLKANPSLLLQIGADFGLTPAAIIGQRQVNGQWRILAELVTEDCGVVRFAELLAAFLRQHFPDHPPTACLGWGDPAGGARAQNDESVALDLMARYTRFRWRPAPTNDVALRREVVVNGLNRLIDGDPGLLVSPTCAVLRKGFTGGYHYKPVKSSNGATFHDAPNKNAFSHPHDALQYLLLGGGEAAVLRSVEKPQRGPRYAQQISDYDPMSYGMGPQRRQGPADYDPMTYDPLSQA